MTISLYVSYTASTKIVLDIVDSSSVELDVAVNTIDIIAIIDAVAIIFLFILSQILL